MLELDDVPTALAGLLSAYAGRDRRRHRLLWTLDARLARLVATTSEPMIGQIRLAWWQEALSDGAGIKGRGEPLVDALRQIGAAPCHGLGDWLDGWEALIGDIGLDAYATGRGGGLFHALAGEANVPPWLRQAGAAWALWDLSGHAGDSRLAAEAIARAARLLLEEPPRWPTGWRPMQLAYALARHDIMRRRQAPGSLTPRLYMRLVRLALLER